MPRDPHSHTALTVLAVCFVMNLMARGFGETYVVFLLPLGEEFGWSRSQLTSVYSVYMLVMGLAAPAAGPLIDRVGPRASYVLGLLSLGGGFLAASRMAALWQFYLCVGLLGGIGVAAMGMVPAQALVSRWFRARLSTAMGVAYAGLGSGMIAVVPITQLMIEASGWRAAYQWLGLVLLATAVVVAALPWQRWAPGHPAFRIASTGTGAGDARGWQVGAALRDRAFWGLFAVFFFTSTAIYSCAIQIVVYLVSIGFDAVTAATAFGATGAVEVVARRPIRRKKTSRVIPICRISSPCFESMSPAVIPASPSQASSQRAL